jgi:hypothetical protein
LPLISLIAISTTGNPADGHCDQASEAELYQSTGERICLFYLNWAIFSTMQHACMGGSHEALDDPVDAAPGDMSRTNSRWQDKPDE